MHYADINMVEEDINGRRYIRSGIRPGDTTEFGAWTVTIDRRSIECDCGKGAFCPYNPQEKK